jgi:predicted ATPase
MAMLRRIVLKGFKSIRAMDLELRPLNVLIGANGAGKSNLISFFKMLNEMMRAPLLQSHVVSEGGGHSLLHYGPAVTPQLEAQLEFELEDNSQEHCTYSFRLSHRPGEMLVLPDRVEFGDSLIFDYETLTSVRAGSEGDPQILSLGAGHEEPRILDHAFREGARAEIFRRFLDRCRVYHFHDKEAVKDDTPADDFHSSELRPDASNLASFLYRIRNQDHTMAYQRIVGAIRLIAPFFRDFDLVPKRQFRKLRLNWRDVESDQLFGPHQLSDGTIRAICLITLLLQPEEDLPNLIIVDEPELGLHPYASNLIASLFKQASHHSQILVSTQSSSFLDQFEPADIIVVDRERKESVFRRPDPEALEAWLDEYSLGEVWEKNVIGGGPH